MKRLTLIIIAVFVAFSVENVNAQNDEPKPKFMVWELELTPTQMEKAKAAVKLQNEFLKEINYPISNLSQTTNEGYYWYSVPFTNYADIDQIMATGKKIWTENEEKLKELQENFKGTYKTMSRFILELHPELSVLPEPGTTSSGDRYRVYQRFHIKPDKAEEFIEVIKQYIALRKNQGITAYFYTLRATFGKDLDIFYFIDEMGTNPAENFTQNEEFWQGAASDGQKLWQMAVPLIDKTEVFHGHVHYDLSYLPSN